MMVPMIGFGQCVSGDCENGYGFKITTVPNLLDGTDGKQLYYGNFVDGKRHGVGQLFYPAGSKYIGEFKDNHPDGYGTMIFLDLECVFSGNFKRGLMHGLVSYEQFDGKRVSLSYYEYGNETKILYDKSK